MKRFEQLKFKKTTTIRKDGMEISAFIAGVNSGAYSLPFVIEVRTWASKFGFKKFFHREMKLSLFEVKMLKLECEKVIEYYKNEKDVQFE